MKEWLIITILIIAALAGGCRLQAPMEETPIELVAVDFDSDNIFNFADNCPYQYNPGQGDIDSDGDGDLCDFSLLSATRVMEMMNQVHVIARNGVTKQSPE